MCSGRVRSRSSTGTISENNWICVLPWAKNKFYKKNLGKQSCSGNLSQWIIEAQRQWRQWNWDWQVRPPTSRLADLEIKYCNVGDEGVIARNTDFRYMSIFSHVFCLPAPIHTLHISDLYFWLNSTAFWCENNFCSLKLKELPNIFPMTPCSVKKLIWIYYTSCRIYFQKIYLDLKCLKWFSVVLKSLIGVDIANKARCIPRTSISRGTLSTSFQRE